MIDQFVTLYNIDSKGKARLWRLETNGPLSPQYRTVSGLLDGKLTASGWTTATPKNVGKANETTADEQALLEIEAEYTKKRDRKYYNTLVEAQAAGAGGHKFSAPMLAEKYEGWAKLKERSYVFTQPKLDGIRAIITKDGARSRQGKPFPAVNFLVAHLKGMFDLYPDMQFDGELYNHDLKNNFDEITSLVKKPKPTPAEQEKIRASIQYHIYDYIHPTSTFLDRNVFIDAMVRRYSERPIYVVRTNLIMNENELDEDYGRLLQEGYEGQMIRLPNSLYVKKRTHGLLKRKEFLDKEFPVLRIEEGEGNWAGYAKRVIIKLPDGRPCAAGLRGNQNFCQNLLHIDPKPTSATIRFQNYTPDGMLRFPVATKFYYGERDD